MRTSGKFNNILLLAVLLSLFLIRIANLHLIGLFDYDAVSNYSIIAALSKGDYTRFYNHVSPFFYLIDCYVDRLFFLVAHPSNFNDIQISDSLIAAKEGTLLNKMLFLEHAEYTGLGFWQTMHNFEKMSKLKNQLYLVKL
jgi:hypothetical protein